MTTTKQNKIAQSIQKEILAIAQFLEPIETPDAFDGTKIEENIDALTTLLPKMENEIALLSETFEKNRGVISGLEEECRSLKEETQILNRTFREKSKELKKLEEAAKTLKDPEMKKKLKAFEKSRLEARKLEEEIDNKNKKLTQLQEKISAFEELQNQLDQNTNEIKLENERISQLEQEIKQNEARLNELVTKESQTQQDRHGKQELKVLRQILTAKHEGLEPPQWEKIAALPGFENGKK